jgi:hypothetical protein
MNDAAVLDLVTLVPGKDERETLDELLSSRRDSLGIRQIQYEILVHTRRDPGCFHEAPDVLQPYVRRARCSMVLLDHEGSGQEDRPAAQVVGDLKRRMESSGWSGRTEILLLQPELENWVWSDSPEVDRALGWRGRDQPLRLWLREKGWWPEGAVKPARPKECLQAALREVQMRRSSAIYRDLASRVSLDRCQDPAFALLRATLREWFGPAP